MKYLNLFRMTGLLLLLLAVTTTVVVAQRPDRDRHRPRPPREHDMERGERRESPPHDRSSPPPMGLFGVLDADRDGTLSAEEIANAPKELAKLDKDGDGQISRRELADVFPMMPPHMRRGPEDRFEFGGPPPRGREGRDDRDGRRPDRGPPEGRRDFRPPRDRDEDRPPPQRRDMWPRGGQAMIDRIMRLDADGDGKISADELPDPMMRFMERVDSDGDGYITESELKQFAERMDERRKQFQDAPRRTRERRPARPEKESPGAQDTSNVGEVDEASEA